MYEQEAGLKFSGFSKSPRRPLYKKIYAFFCRECDSFRQVSDVGEVK